MEVPDCRHGDELDLSGEREEEDGTAVALGEGTVAAPGPAAVDQSVAGIHGILAVMTLQRGKR